eukprot:TRINITY_DN40369_c0_g1_i1.p1 TRINITY_DN40369_c0_g1~~TRINITY_DN40369_c0_g1_i1.p1  ORF type:complete len:778 (-),score=146.49 TRINITY_DN40369_c0_g1_i1:188-2521(-)
MPWRQQSDWPPERVHKTTYARAVVPLPSLSCNIGQTFYKEALGIVRQRKAAAKNAASYASAQGAGAGAAKPKDDNVTFDAANSIVPTSELEGTSLKPRTPLCGATGTTLPKYLRLTCVLHRHSAASATSEAAAPEPTPRKPLAAHANTSPRKVTRGQSADNARTEEQASYPSSVPAPRRASLQPENLIVVEAPLTVVLRTQAGTETKVRPHVWMVVDSHQEQPALPSIEEAEKEDEEEDGANDTEANAHSSDPQAGGTDGTASAKFQVDLLLCRDLGEGVILKRCVPLLRRVPPERVTISAAENNFQRCARGASLLALRHAAFILKALVASGEGIDEVRKALGNSPLTLEEIDAKVSRVAGMVASRAAFANQRTAQRQPPKKYIQPQQPHQEESLKQAEGMSPRQTILQKGFNANLEFLGFCCRKFGNPVRAWFAIDPEEHMKIAEKQFARACEEIGFRGNIVALWRHLDRDFCGHITLPDIDSRSAMILADFKVLLFKECDGNVDNLFRRVQETTNYRMPRDEFISLVKKLRFKGSGKRLFDLLSRGNHFGTISAKDIYFLERWDPPLYLIVQADGRGLEALRTVLREKHENMLRAWWRVLDTEQTMRVTWQKFKTAVAKIKPPNRPHYQYFPRTEEDIACVWRMLDTDCSGWIALREFDKAAFEAASSFKRWADRVHGIGGVAKLMHQASQLEQGNQKLNRNAFRKALASGPLKREEIDLLFDGFDVSEAGLLSEGDLKFLDKWDLVWEEWEAVAHLENGVATAACTGDASTPKE